MGTYAYVTDHDDGLYVINATDPANLVLSGSFEVYWGYDSISVSKNYAYVGGYVNNTETHDLMILDITDPVYPVWKDRVAIIENRDISSIVIKGNFAYTTDGSDKIKSVNIQQYQAEPTTTRTTERNTFTMDVQVEGIAVSSNYAYVANYTDGLKVLDITDPLNPSEVGTGYNTSGYALDVAISGSYAYVADSSAGLQVIDISDPANLTLAGNPGANGLDQDVFISGNYAYVASASVFRIIDISTPTNPTSVGTYATPGDARGVVVSGNYAYIADDAAGLTVLDITDPTTPTEAATLDTSGNALGIAQSGNLLFIANGLNGMKIIDASDPSNPTIIGSFYNGVYTCNSVNVSGDNAYVLTSTGHLFVADVSDPTIPMPKAEYLSTGNTDGLTVSGDYVYVTKYYGEKGIDIINIEAIK
jgi:hypothetical protein